LILAQRIDRIAAYPTKHPIEIKGLGEGINQGNGDVAV
jgi:hypothetical protein